MQSLERGKQETDWGQELGGSPLVKLWGQGVLRRGRQDRVNVEGTQRDCKVGWAGLSPVFLVLVTWDLGHFA